MIRVLRIAPGAMSLLLIATGTGTGSAMAAAGQTLTLSDDPPVAHLPSVVLDGYAGT